MSEDDALLDKASFDELMQVAKERNSTHVQRLHAVETKSDTLVVFSAVLAGLLIGQDAAGTGPSASIAVLMVGLAMTAGAVVTGFASAAFRWPEPTELRVGLESLPRAHRLGWLLHDLSVRGAANHR